MSLTILPEICINCGACEFVCPTGAIHPPAPDAPHPAVFWIATNWCNDCDACVPVCPVDCILPDPDTIVCHGRGCPLKPGRDAPFAGWECTLLVDLCEACGHVKWRPDDSAPWRCVRCDETGTARCPKILRIEQGKTGPQPPRRGTDELYDLRGPAVAP